jgi:hypothetical protein
LAKVIQALPTGQEMDPNESALLQSVVLRWYENEPMTVRDAIGLAQLGSPATLHKRITRLREKDMLWLTSTILTARRQLSWPVEAGEDFNALLA